MLGSRTAPHLCRQCLSTRSFSSSQITAGKHGSRYRFHPKREYFVDGKCLWSAPPENPRLPPRGPALYPSKVTFSDGSHSHILTIAPKPVIELTRDTRNSPLWQFRATGEEALLREHDTSGRLSRFSKLYGNVDMAESEGSGGGEVGQDVKVTKIFDKSKKGKKGR